MRWFFIFGITLFYSLLGVVFALQSQSNPSKAIVADKWIFFESKDGVQFYVQHKSSPFDTRYNTLVRLRNTNSYEVTVMFTPAFFCEDKEEGEEYKYQNQVRINVYPRHSVTLLAYRPCQGDIPEKIKFEQIQINKR
ncbi:MAG: hypothetical protein JJT94_06020 [Bernardetiaceae bacterium]|nr:hypothetical protein [Bernardetiaceae bacterium]